MRHLPHGMDVVFLLDMPPLGDTTMEHVLKAEFEIHRYDTHRHTHTWRTPSMPLCREVAEHVHPHMQAEHAHAQNADPQAVVLATLMTRVSICCHVSHTLIRCRTAVGINSVCACMCLAECGSICCRTAIGINSVCTLLCRTVL